MHLLHPTSFLKLSFKSNWVQKTKAPIYEISWMLFYSMVFDFAHFANFNLAHFEIEESFLSIWVKLQNDWFELQISISGIFKVLVFIRRSILFQVGALFLPVLCMEKALGKFGWKSRNDVLVIDLKIFILVLFSQIAVLHFEYKKVFSHILVKCIVFIVFPTSTRSNKKQFQLVDLAIGRL